jgi:catechol 2,3-dioxygenase-like lactoylglutathione lyase family enzyme
MIHHISIGVSDLSRSTAFYDAVLGALDYGRHMEKAGTVSWRPDEGGTAFWINQRDDLSTTPDNGNHIAFRAASNEQVDAFHAAAIEAGARDDGAPGFRPEYRDTYYGAFVRDPDDHKIEAVHMAAP